jgi:hypothetical protein
MTSMTTSTETDLLQTGIVLLTLAGGGPLPCTPTKTGATSISILNSSLYTIAITIKGGLYEDPTTKGVIYQFTLSPSATKALDVVAGSYETSGSSQDGKARLQTNGALFSKGCDLPFEICPDDAHRTCHPFPTATAARPGVHRYRRDSRD